ncbi:MAG: hypothetical protein Ct9H300mP16_05430 [Pseudomonadota bacterium]|nr:MAG: hypothetical protein Ct9H300mP16_05430 [Pseudomonadota bacterium]
MSKAPNYDSAAVNRMMDLAGSTIGSLGADTERVPRGGRLRRRAQGEVRLGSGPGILVLGHLDTVHLVGTLKSPCRAGARVTGLWPGRHGHERRYVSFDPRFGDLLAEKVPFGFPRDVHVHSGRRSRQPVDPVADRKRRGGKAAGCWCRSLPMTKNLLPADTHSSLHGQDPRQGPTCRVAQGVGP